MFSEIAENLSTSDERPRRRELTERQFAVLRLIAQGSTTAEMGRLLGVSPNTVRGHILAILAKLGARDRAHAVAIAMREGLLR
jgi:DNA-binding CsgD family transcriptional regulator